ncbi:gamma-glutamyltransferase [Microbulbifer flavimaris]|uniref:Glutathione hydrolase proenzyme n=1 Tax=Microbulbifer flavimaris TaxID=1781068 RepID=A0ABX4I105_9GAMM|nr:MULTISPECIES: gamma-glutamyltransferase [Microbulbifer]KUJ83918.1 gamma-glutamyltransferase [Microbulbifer sp. ZGT114]PCO06095.1 gamma-glutamyltransferase [Microbulbifer flavimaris]
MRYLILTLALLSATAGAQEEIQPEAATGRSVVKAATASEFMAVTANPHATRAAVDILARGGTAVDAAIAAQLVLTLVEPQSSGIGGGAFMLSFQAGDQSLHYFDGRETAPAAVSSEHFMQDGQPRGFLEAVIGGHSVGVPGVMRMLELAHQRQGKLPWPSLFEPAIALAEAGFEVSPRLHLLLEKMPRVAVRPAIRDYFFDEGGEPLPVGHRLKNPAYADTLRILAKEGGDAFYRGAIAEAIVEAVRNDPENPGLMTLQDLAKYQAVEREPLCSVFLQYRVCGADAPSSGGSTVGATLGMLEQFPLHEMEAGSAALTHLFIEASELAFADRNTYLADPDFVQVPTRALVAPEYLVRRAKLISSGQASKAVPGVPTPATPKRQQSTSPELPNTSHLVIVDRYGNGVSMTSSIETGFGSRLLVRGFLLNNQLTDFSFVPEKADGKLVANRIQPGKRPRSSMSPTIVFDRDGEMRLLVGSPGGSRIINYTARTILYHLALGMPIAEAVAAGNIGAIGGRVELEPDFFSADTVRNLQELGHTVMQRNLNSGIHAIALTDGKLFGGADPRREGNAAGR